MTYVSPIELITEKHMEAVRDATDNEIFKAVLNVGVNVNKGELIKALEYDRGQYVKGYKDRDAEIVRCKDCRHFTHYADGCGVCNEKNSVLTCQNQNDFCSYGERKGGDDE